MSTYFIYTIYTTVLLLLLCLFVPRDKIHALAIHGIFFGGICDVLAILVVTMLIGAGGYKNYGPFEFLGLPFFPPVAWSIWFIMYFYFLPTNRILRWIYLFFAACYSVVFSNVLVNLDIFQWNYGTVFVPFLIYFTWFSLATWGHQKIDL